MAERRRCPECGSTALVEDSHYAQQQLVCAACGCVLSEGLLTTTYTDEEHLREVAYSHSTGQKEQLSRCLQRGIRRVQDLCKVLQLPAVFEETAVSYFQRALQHPSFHMVSVEKKELLGGCCVFVTCRQHNWPLTMGTICSLLYAKQELFAGVFLSLQKELGLSVPALSLADLVKTHLNSFQLFQHTANVPAPFFEDKEKMVTRTMQLVELASETWLVTGRHPVPIVTAAAFLSWQSLQPAARLSCTLARFCKLAAVDLPPPAHLRLKELLEILLRMASQLAWLRVFKLDKKTVVKHIGDLLQHRIFLLKNAFCLEEEEQQQRAVGLGERSQGEESQGKGSLGTSSPGEGSPDKGSLGKSSPGEGSPDKGSLGTSSPGESSPDKGSLGKSSPGESSPDKGSLGKSSPGEGSPDKGSLGTSSPDEGSPDKGSLGTSSPDESSPDKGSLGKSSPDEGSPDKGSLGKSSPDESSPDKGSLGKSSPDESSPDKGSLGKSSPDEGSPDKGSLGKSSQMRAPGQGLLGKSSPDESSPDKGSLGKSSPCEGSPDKGSLGKSSPGEGSPDKGPPGKGSPSSPLQTVPDKGCPSGGEHQRGGGRRPLLPPCLIRPRKRLRTAPPSARDAAITGDEHISDSEIEQYLRGPEEIRAFRKVKAWP